MFAYGYDQFEKATLSAANVAAAAKQAGLSPDEGAMAPTMVLLPKGKSTADLQFTAQENALCIACGADRLLTLEVPEQPADAAAFAEETLPAAEGAVKQPADRVNGLPKAVWYVGAVVLALLLAFLTLLAYRTARIRRQRKQIREMRMRARRQRDSEFHE